LLTYATASILDDDSTYDVALPDLTSELQALTENPAFQDVALNEELAGLFSGQSSQSEQALAAILTDQTSASQYLSPLLDASFTKETAGQIVDVEAEIERFRRVVDTNSLVEHAIWRSVGERGDPTASDFWQNLLRDLTVLRQDKNIAVLQQASATLIDLGSLTNLLFVSQLQQERMQWLNLYLELSDRQLPEEAAALDRSQLRAVASVMQEAEVLENRRSRLCADFLTPEVGRPLLDGNEPTATQVADQLAAFVIDPAGYRLTAHAISSALSAGMGDSSAGALLYGGDELSVHFRLAERASEWRRTFGTTRRYLQDTAHQNLTEDGNLIYDREIAYYFRHVALLEALAAIEAQRAYADGLAAVFRLPDPVGPDYLG